MKTTVYSVNGTIEQDAFNCLLDLIGKKVSVWYKKNDKENNFEKSISVEGTLRKQEYENQFCVSCDAYNYGYFHLNDCTEISILHNTGNDEPKAEIKIKV